MGHAFRTYKQMSEIRVLVMSLLRHRSIYGCKSNGISDTLHQALREKQMHRIFLMADAAIIASMIGASSFAQSAATAPATTPPVS
jgi:hypothetical protein